ncbi:hypothetical protein GCM10023188_25750 [Pontibacter saemangeumensis]|uniref:Uncharacterized protein n=1 Tax=Pontibacter saemangeumensis TaxID=1084525 RepID=A0ABP8LR64_9BACT
MEKSYMEHYIKLERNDVYLVYVGWRTRARRLLVKVVDQEEMDHIGCEIVGGETTVKTLSVGTRLTINRIWFRAQNKQN